MQACQFGEAELMHLQRRQVRGRVVPQRVGVVVVAARELADADDRRRVVDECLQLAAQLLIATSHITGGRRARAGDQVVTNGGTQPRNQRHPGNEAGEIRIVVDAAVGDCAYLVERNIHRQRGFDDSRSALPVEMVDELLEFLVHGL